MTFILSTDSHFNSISDSIDSRDLSTVNSKMSSIKSISSEQLKQLKESLKEVDNRPISIAKVCHMCRTRECAESMSPTTSGVVLPSKATIGVFESIPNELIQLILKDFTLKELSHFSTFNKWFRDFIVQHFLESRKGLISILGQHFSASDAITREEKTERLEVFSELGLLVKRATCLYPTLKRIEIVINLFNRLDGIPKISANVCDNLKTRDVFQSYGRVIHRLTAGWDDCELKHVFKILQMITKMEEHIRTVASNSMGARTSHEYYIRHFYRMLCADNKFSEESKVENDVVFWLKRIMKGRNLQMRARLLMIIYGPLISLTPQPINIPYVGYWDLTDTFFIENGLDELGYAMYLLYASAEAPEQKTSVLSLLEALIKLPQNWLPENVASLLFYSGDDITYDYFMTKIQTGNYSDVAKNFVYLTLVSYKLQNKDTKCVFFLIEKFEFEHKLQLYNEIAVAFCEAITEVETQMDLEDERDVTEVNLLIEANNSLMKNFMVRPDPFSSQESKSSPCSLYSSQSSDETEE